MTAASESTCRNEYVELLNHLCVSYAPTFYVPQSSRDLIEFSMNHEFMLTRRYIFHLSKLRCSMCHIKLPQLSSSYKESYLSDAPGSLACCSSDSSLKSFSLLSASFGQSAFSPTYDPWTYVDVFDRGRIYKSLISTYRKALSSPTERVRGLASLHVSTVEDKPASRPPSDSKRRRMEMGFSRSRASSVTRESTTSTSKE